MTHAVTSHILHSSMSRKPVYSSQTSPPFHQRSGNETSPNPAIRGERIPHLTWSPASRFSSNTAVESRRTLVWLSLTLCPVRQLRLIPSLPHSHVTNLQLAQHLYTKSSSFSSLLSSLDPLSRSCSAGNWWRSDGKSERGKSDCNWVNLPSSNS